MYLSLNHIFELFQNNLFVCQVLYLCGRGFVWSLKDPETGERPRSIHSKKSNSIFESSPLTNSALKFNLNIRQILELKPILGDLRNKFPEYFEENYQSDSSLDFLINILGLEDLTLQKSSRNLVHEYLSKPHACNLRYI
jgi:hypothetical protein